MKERTTSIQPPEESSNRMFWIVLGILGGIVLISLACLVGVYFFGVLPGRTSSQPASAATLDAQVRQALTATALAASQLSTNTPSIVVEIPSPTPMGKLETSTSTIASSAQTATPNATLALQSAFQAMDDQFANVPKSYIAFNPPSQMQLNESTVIELILDPRVMSGPPLATELATQLVPELGLVTSTANPNLLLEPVGLSISVQTHQIEISPVMQAVLSSNPEGAFTITDRSPAEQATDTVDATVWKWNVTANMQGQHVLDLDVSRLVKVDGQPQLHLLTSFQAPILVQVTPGYWITSLDWKWIVEFILALVGTVLGVLSWSSNRKNKAEQKKPIRSRKKKKQ